MKPHAVCMPIPAQGHINAMLKLAKLLHSKDFHITFVHSEKIYERILQSNKSSSLQGLVDFRFETIPEGISLWTNTDAGQDVESLIDSSKKSWFIPFNNLIRRLNDTSSGVPPVTCIVSDTFTSFTLEVAAEHRIPSVFFCSVSACGYMGFLQCKQLMARGLTPVKSESDLTNGYLDTVIDWIPGMRNIRLRDLPSFIRTTNPRDIFLNSTSHEAQRAFETSAIILNTFDHLEGPVLEALALILPPIYAVGPLSLLCSHIPNGELSALGSSFWKEDLDCLQWLDGRKPGSIIYVNFGSIAVMTNEYLIEFAWGLADSGYDFLWVIRPDLMKGESSVLPQEFETQIEGRGLLVNWCSQEQVLSQPSIGGFLTHCGWNSIMESISHGVPMLCWPLFGDQQTNCHYVCDEWGIGMEIDNEVKREQVKSLIKELMDGEKGNQMRKKAMEWKQSAVKATEPGGSSFINIDKVIKEVLLQAKAV